MFSGSSSGLAVGLTIGVLLLIPFIGIPVCIGIKICYSSNGRSQRPLRIRTRVVATTPTTGATVVTSNQTTAMTNPSLYAQPQYPQQPQPPVLYTQPQYPQYPQHPVHEDAQLSFHEPPPSYDDVIAAGSPTQPVVICSWLHVVEQKCPCRYTCTLYVLVKALKEVLYATMVRGVWSIETTPQVPLSRTARPFPCFN